MRPRHEASENDEQEFVIARLGLASMRPRHEASENLDDDLHAATSPVLQ